MKFQRKRNNFIFYLIVIIFLFKFSLCYIVLPFKINLPPKTSNITEIVYNLIDNKLVVTLPIGEPKTNIDFYSSMNLYLYYLEEGSCLPNSSPTYHYSKSKTFSFIKNITHCNVKLDSCSLGQDKLYLFKDIDLKETTELFPFKFFYGTRYNNKKNKEICGQLGHKIDNSPYHYYEYENFIRTLKKYELISTYSWYIHYFEKPYKKNEKEFYDGAIIYDIYNEKFFEDFPFLQKGYDNNEINAKDLEAILSWLVSFDKIYYNINDTRIDINNLEGGLAFETDFILCPEAYFESIKIKFFDNFFKKNICFLENGRYHFIYCDKNNFKEHVKNFPVLYLKNNGLNKTFDLNGDDLFQEYNNYLLFMVAFKEYSYKLWTLGKVFMKKYNFYFDSDKKLIGCFEKIIQEKEKNNFITFFDKIKWYLFIIIGIIIGFLIGKKIRDKARKLRANELEDNYEYLENKINSKDNSKDIIPKNSNISNYKEIKSQLFEINQ